jgi:hypothetical protein
VTVEAIVDDILTVNKDEPNMPDIIGVLREEHSDQKRLFVVNDDVKHPYLEPNRRFEFRNVKDHYYEAKDEVQVMITEHTNYEEGDIVGQSPGSSSSYTSSTSSSRAAGSRSSTSSSSDLHDIAKSMIGDDELTVTGDDESSIEKAKKKAKRQNRDPAIDPKFQADE